MTTETKSVEEIVERLGAKYGSPDLGNKSNPLDELIFILLSEKTNEAKYSRSFNDLKARFPYWREVLSCTVEQLGKSIWGSGMKRRRALLIHRLVQEVARKYPDLDLSPLLFLSAPEAEEHLIRLPGIGRKAARCLLLYCFNAPVLPVDIHTFRLAIRLGIISRLVSYERSHSILQDAIPPHLRKAFHVNAVAHGRTRCFARNPKCSGCPVSEYCSYPSALKPLTVKVRPNPLAIDLFSGAGGLSLGFKNAGYQVVQGVEANPHAAATYRHNNPEVDLLESDIRSLEPAMCLERLGLRPGDISVLIGGPPCQGFSEANRRTRSLSNMQNHFYLDFLRFLHYIKPAWFVFENVSGIRTLSKSVILDHLLSESRKLSYNVDWKELNASDYGVPQSRRRIFVVGNRLGLPVAFPKKTHGPKLIPHVTVRDATEDLPILANGASIDYLPYNQTIVELSDYSRALSSEHGRDLPVQGNLVTRNSPIVLTRYEYIPPGQNWEAIPRDLLGNYHDVSRCHTGIYYRLEWDKPSKVLGNFRKNMLIHPDQSRGLSIREAARLQSFPDQFVFLGSIGFQQQKVADAVPPMLAEAVARTIRKMDGPRGAHPTYGSRWEVQTVSG